MTRKWTKPLVTALLSLCLLLSAALLCFTAKTVAKAATVSDDNGTITFDSLEDFETTDGVLKGLTDASIDKFVENMNRNVAIHIPDGITKIESDAFSTYQGSGGHRTNFRKLRNNINEVILPNTVAEIGVSAFSSVSDHTFEFSGTFSEWCDVALGDRYATPALDAASVRIQDVPESITLTQNPGYYLIGLKEIKTVLFGESYAETSISDYAFCNTGITTVGTIPSSVETIGRGAFYGTGITELSVPSSVTEIKYDAFADCVSLKKLSICANVDELPRALLSGCSALEELTVPFVGEKKNPMWGDDCFLGVLFEQSETSDNDFVAVYQSSSSYANADAYLIPRTLKTVTVLGGKLGTGAFGSRERTSWAFTAGTTNALPIETIVLADGVSTVVDDYAFFGAANLKKIEATKEYTCNESNTFTHAGVSEIAIPTEEKGDFIYVVGTGNIVGLTDSGKTKETFIASNFAEGTTLIAAELFKDNQNIKNIVIPASVTTIGNAAFERCSNLTTVEFENAGALKTLGENAFKDCEKLSGSIVLPDGLTEIPSRAFYNTALQSITIPSSVVSIGYKAFQFCRQLGEVVFDNIEYSDLTSIGTDAFFGCGSLLTIEIPSRMTNINASFGSCDRLIIVYNYSALDIQGGSAEHGEVAKNAAFVLTEKGDETIESTSDKYVFVNITDNAARKHYLVRYDGSESDIVLPKDYNGEDYTIFRGVFQNRAGLTSVTLPDNNRVEAIGSEVFANCKDLITVTLGESVNEYVMGDATFSMSSKLKSVTIRGGSSIGNESFRNCESLYSLSLTESTITEIGKNAFFYCKALRTIALPDTVRIIGQHAFDNCVNLENISLGSGVEAIGDFAFYGCRSLQTFVVPASVTAFGTNFLSGCGALKSITFAEGSLLTEITANAALGGGNVTELRLPASVQTIGNGAFADNIQVLHIGANLKSVSVNALKNVQTIYLAEDAEISVLNALFADNVQCLSDLAVIAYNKAHYDKLYSNATSNAKAQLFYEADVAFKLYDEADKMLSHITQIKLVSNDGASIKYNKTGSVWAIDDDYSLPTAIGVFGTDAGGWGTTTTGTMITPAVTEFVNKLSANETVYLSETDIRIDYLARAWTVDDYIAGASKYLKVVSINGNANGVAENVGTYTVVFDVLEGYAWAAGSQTQITLTIEKCDGVIVWDMSGNWSANGNLLTKTYNGNSIDNELTIKIKGSNGAETVISGSLVARYYLNGQPIDLEGTVNAGGYIFRLSSSALDAYLANYNITNLTSATEQQFLINPVELNASDIAENLSWNVDGRTAALSGGMLYIYTNGHGDIVPSYTQLGAEYTLVEVVNVDSSIVKYTDADQSLCLALKSTVASYALANSQDVKREIGKYTSQFTLTAASNYVFAQDIVVSSQGLIFTASDDGRMLTINKVWYIVQLNNELTDGNGNLYSIAGWTFGDDVTIPLPTLENGSWIDTSYIFALKGNNGVDLNNLSNWENYINKSMPAGIYTVNISVAAFTYEGTAYPQFSRVYTFTVAKAEIVLDLDTTNDGYAFYEWELTANANRELFFGTFADIINADNVLSLTKVTPTGYWATEAAKAYFGDYEISYNLNRMNSDGYVSSNNNDILSLIGGGANGTYTVYFQVTAPNHRPLAPNDDGRYEYFFTVVVYEVLDTPVVEQNTLVYTGTRLLPETTANELYATSYEDTDDCVNAGIHNILFTLYDTVHYRWKAGDNVNGATASATFEILKSANDWLEAPDIVRWVEGKYNEEENTFIGAAKFGEITYIITDADDNVLYDAAQGINKLASLKAGKYFLRASVAATDNYTGLSEAFTIRVLEKIGLPWWGTLCITLGALLIAAIIILILWKKGVFQILTGKIVLAIRTRASVDATIASVRAAKRMEEGKKSVAEAKRRERMEEARRKAEAERALPPEERAAIIEAKAQAQAKKAEKMRLQSEAMKERAKKVRGSDAEQQPTEPEQEAAAADDTETPTEE